MARRIVVFPVKGRRWAFAMANPPTYAPNTSPHTSFLQVYFLAFEDAISGKGIATSFTPVARYVSNKLEEKWVSLGAAPQGSMRNRLHSMGEKMLSKIKPSESFLRSIPEDASKMEIVFPSSLNPRLVRRRVRLIGMSGTMHAKYLYGSIACLPFTVLLGILPVPNLPFFWNLFRTYANWQALQGSRRLLQFVEVDGTPVNERQLALVLLPSKTLKSMMHYEQDQKEVITDSSMANICKSYHLDYSHVLKWREFGGKKMKMRHD